MTTNLSASKDANCKPDSTNHGSDEQRAALDNALNGWLAKYGMQRYPTHTELLDMLTAALANERGKGGDVVERLEKLQEQGDTWITIAAVLQMLYQASLPEPRGEMGEEVRGKLDEPELCEVCDTPCNKGHKCSVCGHGNKQVATPQPAQGAGEVEAREALRKIKARIHAERYECTPLTVDDASTGAEKELMCIIDYIDAEVDAALQSPARVEGWRPIETPPENSEWVIVGWPEGACHIGKYSNGDFWFPSTRGNHMCNKIGFTHWQPLPTPPKPDAGSN